MSIMGSMTHGYTSAYTYYKELKNKMLDEVAQNMKINDMLNSGYSIMKNDLENNILMNATSYFEGRSEALDALDAMEVLVGDMILNQDLSGVRTLMQDLTSKAIQSNSDIEKQVKFLKDALKMNQDKIFAILEMDRQMLTSVINTTSGDTTDIVNQLSSYFIRYLYNQLFLQFNIASRYQYEMSLAGFYKEAAEYEVLSQYLNKSLNVFHAGTKNTELDIILTSLDSIESALANNTEITKIISAGDFTDIQRDLIAKINVFGEQVKSWSLNSKAQTHHIGNRVQLFNAYLSEKGVNEDYSTADSARFLARFENILLALGPTNVLFSSNNSRQWMCDFIFDFRQKNFFLVFGRATNTSPLTPSVDLEQYFTEKKAVRQRFLS